ncbi:MAG: DUF924 family protein [Sneathiellaceae bacterium]
MTEPQDVLDFWFAPDVVALHWKKDPDFDERIRARFGAAHADAAAGRLDHWRSTADGALALLILLDQFSRNLFRDSPKAYACDAEARQIAFDALARGLDLKVAQDRRHFFYLPLEHSEDPAHQDRCVELMRSRTGDQNFVDYAKAHQRIVARFGRFPHRNAVLGRVSTAEEEAFLLEPNSSF